MAGGRDNGNCNGASLGSRSSIEQIPTNNNAGRRTGKIAETSGGDGIATVARRESAGDADSTETTGVGVLILPLEVEYHT